MKRIKMIGQALLIMLSGTSIAQDLTPLQGWQIRPYHTFLRTGKTTTLSVKFCQPADTGEDDLTSLVSDCDDNDLNRSLTNQR